jgi:GT2 family glycosyltransferase
VSGRCRPEYCEWVSMPESDDGAAEITAVVVTWQGAELLPTCLDSLAAQTVPHRVLVVDNASSDSTADILKRYDVEVLTLDRNTGFAGGVAAALGVVRSEYVALLNNDASADPRWLEASAAALNNNPGAAAITSRLVLWDLDSAGRFVLNNVGVALTAGGYGTDRGFGQPDGPPFDRSEAVFGFSGGASVLRRSAVVAAGGIAPRFFMYYEDTDLSWRLRLAGYSILYEPAAVVHHRHGASSNLRSESFAYFTERNRLLVLLRCAPLGFALRQIARFVLTTCSLAARRMVGQRVPDAAVFRVTVRVRALVGVAYAATWAIRSRRSIGRSATIPRSAIIQTWLSRQQRD